MQQKQAELSSTPTCADEDMSALYVQYPSAFTCKEFRSCKACCRARPCSDSYHEWFWQMFMRSVRNTVRDLYALSGSLKSAREPVHLRLPRRCVCGGKSPLVLRRVEASWQQGTLCELGKLQQPIPNRSKHYSNSALYLASRNVAPDTRALSVENRAAVEQ